jgi:hypothetical protein
MKAIKKYFNQKNTLTMFTIKKYFENREEYIDFIRPYIYPDNEIHPPDSRTALDMLEKGGLTEEERKQCVAILKKNDSDSYQKKNYLTLHRIAGIGEILHFFYVDPDTESFFDYDDEGYEINESGDVIPPFDLDKAGVYLNFPGTFVGEMYVIGEFAEHPYVVRFSEFVEHKKESI